MIKKIFQTVMISTLAFMIIATNITATQAKATYPRLNKEKVTINIVKTDKKVKYGSSKIKMDSKDVDIVSVSYKNLNKKIVKVDKTGKVKAKKPGRATIKVKVKFYKNNIQKDKTLKYIVTVKNIKK